LMSEPKKADIKYRFKKSMILSKEVFGDAAFCKKKDYKRINKALYEVIAVSFAKLSEDQRAIILKNKVNFIKIFYESIPKNFAKSLTSNTDGKSNVILRHTAFKKIVDTILNQELNKNDNAYKN